ncbi:helix-turn-helix transcriptional regulator [Thermasporomyces composti]|uniref:Regulatory LuxR family protein n=1 Tax=Thermasporomyces composti TaxID=696763 RepID=A0A3D9VCX1_THECX|nr:AAA family ATPase [Thermasporomyces composti]REF36014.1 regulatory LuxR family protein [Thermasporomyces composti]
MGDPRRGRAGDPLLRGASPFVGHADDLAAVAAAVQRPPALILVAGEPGIGKTRLVQECLALHDPGRVAVAACPPLPEPFPLGPVVDSLRRRAVQAPELALSPLGGALRPLFPELWDRLPPPLAALTDPKATRHRLFRALTELVESLGIDVLVVEDAHWADSATLEWLLTLCATPPPGLVVVLTYRPTDIPADSLLPRLVSLPAVTMTRVRVELQPLDVAETRTLIAALVGTSQVSEEFAGFLHAHTDGVPLAIEECLRLLRDRRDIVERGGRWVRRVLAELQVPPTIRDSVLERVSRLPAPARAILDAAAVLAEPADEPTLGAVADLDEAGVRSGLAAALASGLLREVDPERYAFRHVLDSQSVGEAIPVTERRRLHRRAAEYLERLDPAPVVRLRRHFREAGDHAAWCRYAEESADLAWESGDGRAAVVALLELLTAGDHPPERRARLARKLGEVAYLGSAALGSLSTRVVEVLRAVLADGVVPPSERGELRLLLGRMLREVSEEPEAYAAMEAAVEDLDHRPELAARAMLNLAMPLVPDWPVARHRAWLDRATALLPRLASPSDRLPCEVHRATTLLLLGEEEGWRAAAEVEARASARRAPERLALARCHLNTAQLAVVWGRYAEVRPRLEAALEHLNAVGYQRLHTTVRMTGVHLDWYTGAWDGLADKAADIASSELAVPLDRLHARQVLGALALARGARDEALRHLTEVTREYARLGVVDPLALLAAAALARLHRADGNVDAALAVVERDITVINRKGTWWWATDLVPVAVDCLVAAGRVEEAARLVDRFATGLDGRGGPAPAAALTTCQAIVTSARGGPAADSFAAAREAWSALSRPYDELLAAEREARCRLAAGMDEHGLASLAHVQERLWQLGARWDADRVARTLRDHGVGVTRTWRRGPRGYGDQLSPRELEVVGLVARGLTNRQIADLLYLSPRTVGHHLRSAMRKLRVTTRTAVAVTATETGLLHPEPASPEPVPAEPRNG